jgi:hypothetical protein
VIAIYTAGDKATYVRHGGTSEKGTSR